MGKIDDLIALAENITKILTDYKHATSRRSRSRQSQLQPRIRTAKDAPLLTISGDHQDKNILTIIKGLEVLMQKAQRIVNDEKGVTNVTTECNNKINTLYPGLMEHMSQIVTATVRLAEAVAQMRLYVLGAFPTDGMELWHLPLDVTEQSRSRMKDAGWSKFQVRLLEGTLNQSAID
jgi:hypothetical protein